MSSNTPSLEQFAARKLEGLERRHLRRRLVVSDNQPSMKTVRDGRLLTNFCSNDYLGMAHDPAVIAAAQAATERYGAGSGASRLVSGGHPLLFELEARLAAVKGSEDCIVFGSGYLANLAITPALAGPGDLILIDELAHACLHSGAKLSGAETLVFRHNDMTDLEAKLAKHRTTARHTLILTDGVFSMDGDIAPLPQLNRLAEQFDAWLLVDDAHGLGVTGDGQGTAHAFTPPSRAALQMGTLSKALGSYGGYLCASRNVCELLRTRARPLVFTTALPPSAIAGALKALELIEADQERCARPTVLARRFARACGLPEPASPIVPVIIGEEADALAASTALQEAGFLVTAIRPPTVPRGTARLRITFSAAHSESDVDALADQVAPMLNALEAVS
ncbi:8-amino-7-oxononanoate synthase [Maricaulis sp.]|uniref:8-amino-7-oxononanoate synthase n=1 Tax=Maricaulis sp. TaxID=1486257 RepID=UPI0026118713|nr:8-amino-7-oxononanoate synthase [Maricaulis sp.]